MGFLTKEGLQNLTNKLVQGDAIKVASHRGKNVKEVIDNIQRECESVVLPNTMTLENRVSEFRVGKGRDVDVSGDVEEGKVEVELKGKTYQNLCQKGVHFNTSHSELFEIEDTEEFIRVIKTSDEKVDWSYAENRTLQIRMIKPNTDYTIIFKVKTSTNRNNLNIRFMDGNASNIMGYCDLIRVVGDIFIGKLRTISTFDNLSIGQQVLYINHPQSKLGEWCEYYKSAIVLEGDYTQTPVEELPKYFEGIKSSFEDGVVDVEVVGKNLLSDYSLYNNNVEKLEETNEYIITRGDGNIGGGIAFRNTIVEPDTYYSFSMTCQRITPDNHNSSIRIWHTNNKEYINVTLVWIDKNMTRVKGAFKTPKDCSLIDIWCGKSSHYSEKTTFKFMKDWQLEKNKKATPSQPYYKKKISFNIGEPLRSLPNGVCDEIRNNNGQWELVRRVHKVVLDGSEIWTRYERWDTTNTMQFYLNYSTGLPNTLLEYSAGYCDRFAYKSYPEFNNKQDREGFIIYGGYKNDTNILKTFSPQISISKSKLSTLDVNGFKQWLSQNPTTFYYQLETPTITPIEPMEFDVKPLATMTINSEIAPISNHKVILNRAGQIEQGIELIADLRNRINNLESIYDSNLIATQYKLDNLKLNYELEREED